MKKLYIILLLLVALAPISVFAEAGQTPATYSNPDGSAVLNGNITYVPLEPIPGLPVQTGNVEFGILLNAVFKVLIIMGGIIATGSFVYAGVVYMTSEVIGSKKNAISRLNASLLGLLLLIGSWLILYTINPQLIVFTNALNPVGNYAYVPGPVNTDVPAITTNGGTTAPVLTSTAQDAAIKAAQSNPNDPAAQAKAAQEIQKADGVCAGTYKGDVATSGNSCTQDGTPQFLGTKTYTNCATIKTVAGTQSCFYNK